MSELRKENRSAAVPILIAVLGLAVPLGAYVAGYYGLGPRVDDAGPALAIRVYPYDWLATIYRPMAAVESVVSGQAVLTVGTPPDGEWQSYPPMQPISEA